MEYARVVRTKAALESVEKFTDEIRKELETDQRPEIVDELLEAMSNEIYFMRVNLLGTLKIEVDTTTDS